MDVEIASIEKETLNSFTESTEIMQDNFHNKSIFYLIGIGITMILIFIETRRIRSIYTKKDQKKQD